jgi:hypothetical protein
MIQLHPPREYMMKNTAKARTRKVTIASTAKGLTAQAGMVPVIGFMNKQGFYKQLQSSLTLQRSSNASWQLEDIVYLTTGGIIAGSDALSSVKTVWSDPVLREIDGWQDIPNDTTLSRIFKECAEAEITDLQTMNHRFRDQIWEKLQLQHKGSLKRRKSYWIDIDSTVKTVYGNQEGAVKGFNAKKKGALSYHPLLAFCAYTKEIVQGLLRPGNVYTNNGSVDFVKQIQSNFSNKRLILRGDSGFFSGDLLDLLDGNGDGYLIKVKLKNLDQLLTKQNWRSVRNRPGYEQCRFEHICSGWSRARSFVAIRKEKPKEISDQLAFYEPVEYENFCYVQSENFNPWVAHKTYSKRATCETWIEESKNQMALAHIKTDSFLANAAIFQCAVLAYNIVRWMAALSSNKRLMRWEAKTIRCFIMRVAGRLIRGSRRLLNTPSSLLFKKQWEAWLKFST